MNTMGMYILSVVQNRRILAAKLRQARPGVCNWKPRQSKGVYSLNGVTPFTVKLERLDASNSRYEIVSVTLALLVANLSSHLWNFKMI